LGVDVSARLPGQENLLLLSFFDRHDQKDLDALVNFFKAQFSGQKKAVKPAPLSSALLRKNPVNLPNWKEEDLYNFYRHLEGMNVSPDDAIYPLGSCTMKYNPYSTTMRLHCPVLLSFTPRPPKRMPRALSNFSTRFKKCLRPLRGFPEW
jgi:glycine dehydrogenase